MTGLWPLLGKELREQWRTKRLLVVLVVFAIFGIGSPLLAKYTPDLIRALASEQLAEAIPSPTTADAVDQFLKNVGQTGVLAAILLAMGSVALDKERGIAALFLTKPASRGAYLLAKLAAIAVTLLVGVMAATAAGYGYTAWLFEALPLGGYLAMGLLLFLQLLVYASLTFLGSTLARSSLVAGAFGIAVLALIAVVGALPGIGPYTPGGLSTGGRALAIGLPPEQLAGPLLVNLALVAGVFAIAWLAFRRQEL
ncbi:MAG TPA: ABC transporter permease subunit [Candidatus Limnocylindria bacterium]|jgi:ABC-2 type transport system permease protein|nr:ABC transporter permease subunit [Candidatus Limnocylindria bacterium]